MATATTVSFVTSAISLASVCYRSSSMHFGLSLNFLLLAYSLCFGMKEIFHLLLVWFKCGKFEISEFCLEIMVFQKGQKEAKFFIAELKIKSLEMLNIFNYENGYHLAISFFVFFFFFCC